LIPSRPRTAFLLIAGLSLLAPFATAETLAAGSNVALSASRLSMSADGEEVVAEGEVRLAAQEWEIEGERIVLHLETGTMSSKAPLTLKTPAIALTAAAGELSAGGRAFRLERPEILRLGDLGSLAMGGDELRCEGGLCLLLRGHGTACPHQPPGYHLEADEIALHPSGDIDLTRPALFLGDAKVVVLPWIRIRPPNEPGFLAPKIGYSHKAGFIAGPAGFVPLGGEAYAEGHVAGRTSEGFEDGTHLHAPGTDLRIDHVFAAPKDNSGRARLVFASAFRKAAIAVDADAVTSREFIEEMTFDPLERAISHAESRALFSMPGDSMIWESALLANQPLLDRAAGELPGFETRMSVRGSLVARPIASRIFPGLELDITRRDVVGDAMPYDARGLLSSPHTRLFAAPSLSAPFSLGPFSAVIDAQSRHVAWLIDGETTSRARHDVNGAAEIYLPLVGRLAGLVHLVTPKAAYRIAPFVHGDEPPFAFDGLDRAREAHALEAGFDTALDPFARVPLAEMTIRERVFLPGLSKADGAYLFARLRVGAPWLYLRSEIAWDERRNSVSAAAAGIGTDDEHGDRLSVDARWYGRGDGPHLDGQWTGGDGARLGDGFWLGAPEERLEIDERASAVVARFVVLSAGAQVEVYPSPGLDALWYGLALRSACGCAEIGLRAAHRLDTWAPDVMLTFVLK